YFSGGEALSPFEEARVLEVRWFDAPRRRRDAVEREPFIALWLGGGLVAKILHVEPRLRIGERLVLGDPLGRLVVSGYFYHWSEKHMHLELRVVHDRYRARGGARVKLLVVPWLGAVGAARIYGEVVYVDRHFALVKPRRPHTEGPTPIALGQGFLEGGYPHYRYAAVLAPRFRSGLDLGTFRAATIENMPPPELPRPFVGIATFIGRPYVKLVSREPLRGVAEGDPVEIRWSVPDGAAQTPFYRA
ncbi:MAG: hypothetical protein DRO39_04610, partial [Thermoprotei archaeon]